MSNTDLARCDIPPDWVSDFSQCLYEWQGLEGAGLALLAAFVGAWFLKSQIKQAGDHRKDEIARRHNAARLTLPLALASVSELIQKTVHQIAYELEQFGPDGFRKAFDANVEGKGHRRSFDPVRLSDDVISAFRQLVESLTDHQDVRHVAELVASLQIYSSRYDDFDLHGAGSRTNLEGLLLDAAKIQLLNDKIYNYARFVDDASFGVVGVGSVADAWDEIHGKAQGLVFRRDSPDFFFPAFQERIDRYKERGLSPWIEKFGG
jgi:hypothetical protein